MLILTTAQRVHYGLSKEDAARITEATAPKAYSEGTSGLVKYLRWSMTKKLHWFCLCTFLKLLDRKAT